MKTAITITDLTRMQGNRVCVAGYTAEDACIRPIFKTGGLTEEWLRIKGQIAIRPFATIEFDVQGAPALPLPPHMEDRVIDPTYCVRRGILTPEQRADWLRKADDGCLESIFGATVHHDGGNYILAGEGKRSLGTIRVQQLSEVIFAPINDDRWNYRLIFTDQSRRRYRLAVTDLAFRSYLDYLRDQCGTAPAEAARALTTTLQQLPLFLRIGLARGWERFPDRCYVQITGVYSFPDYLSGRCFADFAPAAATAPADEGFFARLSRFFR